MNAHPRDESAAPAGRAAVTHEPPEGIAALLDVLPVGVFVLDRAMHVRTMNPVAADLVGWRAGAARDVHCRDLMRCVLCDDDCVVRRASTSGKTHLGGSVCVRRRGGGTLPARLDAVALDGDSIAVTLRPEGPVEPDLEGGVYGCEQEERIRAALRRGAGSVTVAARLLGVHRTTMWRWMAERGLSRRDFRPG